MADPVSWLVISAVVSTGVSYLFPSEGPRMADLRVSASTYGSIISEVYGTCRVGGNMIWSNPIRERKKKKSGKGGSYYNEYTYFCDFAMAYCHGPIRNFRRIWADGKLVYDATGASEAFQTGEYRFRFYLGDENQLPDSLIMASKGEDNTPAYRGLAYMVFENAPITNFGNRIPQLAAEVYNPGQAVDQPVAPVTDYLDQDYDFPNGATRASGAPYNAMADLNNGLMYAIVRGVGDNPDGLVVMNYVTGEVLRYTEALSGENGLERILAIADDGSILMHRTAGLLFNPIIKVDPVSLTVVGAIGVAGTFDPGDQEGLTGAAPIPIASFGARPAGATNANFYCHIGFNAGNPSVQLIDLSTMQVVPYADSAWLATGCSTSVVADRENAQSFYMTGTMPGGAAVRLARFDGSGPPVTVGTLTAAALGAAKITASCVLWDDSSPGPIVVGTVGSGQEGFMVKFSPDDGRVVWSTRGLPGGLSLASVYCARIASGEFCWTHANRLYAIDTDTGVLIDRDADPYSDMDDDYNPDDGASGVPIGRSVSSSMVNYDGVRGLVITDRESVNTINALGGSVTLAAIVASILGKTDLLPEDYDLSALATTLVRGYGWASATDVKSILAELRNLYLFDLVEVNGRLVARMRGDGTVDAVNFTIPQDVLGSTSDEAMDFWQETRLSEADLPERVALAYMNIDDDFETSTASSIRVSNPIPTMFSRQQVAFQASLVATATEAKNIVHRILYTQWLERTKHETRLPWAYLDLDPSDIIKVEMNDGRSYFDRVHATEVGANFNIEVEAYGQDSGAYESTEVGEGGGAGRNDTVTLSKTAVPFVLNTPLLRDSDDTAGGSSTYYTAVSQQNAGAFGGAMVFRSVNAQDYDELYGESAEVEWGVLAKPLPPPRYGYEALDWENEINVAPGVNWFDISSITDDELWAGANMVVVGEEVIQFRDAVKNADGTWTLRNLLRGRRGSEYACATHKTGERFVFLDSATIEKQGDVTTARNQSRSFKAVAPGRNLSASTPLTILYEPRDLMPYAVADIRRSFVGSDTQVAWSRRTRLGGNMQDGTGDVPLSEARELYEVYILNEAFSGDESRGAEPAPQTVTRTTTVTSPSFTYTADMMAEDGHVMDVDTLHLVIYQMSDAVGRGFPSARSITPDRQF